MKEKFILLSLLLPVGAFSQKTQNDSVKSKQLEEVVVEAKMQTTTAGSTTYYPDKNSKRTAQNALDLINLMGIPQINVDLATNTVETTSGKNVAVFIDMEPASEEEKAGLRAEDVKKVEYLVFPTDPRFNNNKYVINITLRHIDFGGYTKLQGNAFIMAGSGRGLIYTKLSHKKMTYDISVSDKYTSHNHSGNDVTQIFKFPQTDGNITEITRKNIIEDSKFQQNLTSASIRLRYTSDKTSISNSFNFTSQNTPHSDYTGKLLFPDSQLKGGTSSNLYSSNYLYPNWYGYWYFDLGNGFKLNAHPAVFYQHTRSNRLYSSESATIATDAVENAVTGQLRLQLAKKFNKHHTINVYLVGVYFYDKIKYTGSTIASPEFNQYAYGGVLGYGFSKGKFYTLANFGFAGESNKISGNRTNSFLPLIDISAQYAFNDKNSLSLSMNYNIDAVDAAEKTPDMIRENELLYKTGNVHLKNTHWLSSDIEYTWLPNNKFSLSTYAGWSRYLNRPVPIYTPDGPDGTMLQRIENNGDFQNIYLGASLTARLLNRKFVLKLNPQACFERSTGIYAASANYISIKLTATYYIGKFYLSASFSNANRELVNKSLYETESKGKNYYYFRAGWSNGKFNVSASAVNIFRKSWQSSTSSLKSQWFDQYTQSYGTSSHQYVNITASYTFGFGKKVKRGDEISSEGVGKSAIMQ